MKGNTISCSANAGQMTYGQAQVDTSGNIFTRCYMPYWGIDTGWVNSITAAGSYVAWSCKATVSALGLLLEAKGTMNTTCNTSWPLN